MLIDEIKTESTGEFFVASKKHTNVTQNVCAKTFLRSEFFATSSSAGMLISVVS